MRQHFYTYPTVVELPGQRPDIRTPLLTVAHADGAPHQAGASVRPAAAVPAR